MEQSIHNLFTDSETVAKIQKKLPQLFYTAELESSRAGKVGMEVGSLRERILVALLLYKFGEENVTTDIPITKAEIDVILFDNPISIKTFTVKTLKGKQTADIKLVWTVDPIKVKEFTEKYKPEYDILIAQINWKNGGGLYLFPKSAQQDVFEDIGAEKYLKPPKGGTNPRGVEMSKDAVGKLIKHTDTLKIPINWKQEKIEFDPFEKWVEFWKED